MRPGPRAASRRWPSRSPTIPASVTAVWTGRRAIGGITLGRTLVLEGVAVRSSAPSSSSPTRRTRCCPDQLRRRHRPRWRAPASARMRPMIVDCGVYVQGDRVDVEAPLPDIFVEGDRDRWLRLARAARAEPRGVRPGGRGLRPAPAGRRGRRRTPSSGPSSSATTTSLFLVLKPAYARRVGDGGEVVETGEVMVFVGEHFVVTVRHGAARLDDRPAAATWRPTRRSSRCGPSAVLHAVADKVVDDYLAVVDARSTTTSSEIEDAGVRPDAARRDIERIYQLKRDVIEMKRAVAPLDAAAPSSSAERPRRLMDPEIREYFRDVARPPRRGSASRSRTSTSCSTSILQASAGPVAVQPERGHAQDLGLGRDRGGADDDRRHLRDELRAHARAAAGTSATRSLSA